MPENERQPEQAPPTPRWVKVFGIIALVVLILAAIIVATDLGGEHGPGRHSPAGWETNQTLADSTLLFSQYACG